MCNDLLRGGALTTAALVLAIGLPCGLGGCASTGAPPGWLPTAAEVGQDPYGGWITVELAGESVVDVRGELIAVAADSLHVLSTAGFTTIAFTDIRRARLGAFDPETDAAGNWVAGGALSTASHGIGLVISLPVWLIAGSSLAGTHSRTPLIDVPQRGWDDLRPYARFPQGLPPGLERRKLYAKSGEAAWRDSDGGSQDMPDL